MEYRRNDVVSNQRLIRETESRPITSIVHQSQLWLYWHVARYSEADPASRVISERDNPEGRRPRGRPQSSWLGQVDASCWELIGMGRWLRGDLHGVIARAGVGGLARRRASWRMSPMID